MLWHMKRCCAPRGSGIWASDLRCHVGRDPSWIARPRGLEPLTDRVEIYGLCIQKTNKTGLFVMRLQ